MNSEDLTNNDSTKRCYSYHTFIFPFVWKNQENETLTYKNINEIFAKNEDNWEQKKLNMSGGADCVSDYGVFKYFYPQVIESMDDIDRKIVSKYSFKLHSDEKEEDQSEYHIVKNSCHYILKIKKIELSIYNTGVALLLFECENDKPNQRFMKAVKDINEYGRHFALPYIPSDNSVPGECAEKLYIKIPRIKNPFTTDFSSFVNNVNEGNENNTPINFYNFGDHVKGILNYKNPDDKDIVTFSSNKEKGKYFIQPALRNDCMYVCSIVTDEEEMKKYRDLLINDDSFDSRIEDARSLYELIFIDKEQDCTCQSDTMLKDLLESHVYKRWINYGSIYAVTLHGLFLIFDGKAEHLYNSFPSEYVRMACLCIAQKASLILFQKEAALISVKMQNGKEIQYKNKRHKEKRKGRLRVISELISLREKFSAFISQSCFNEITPQEQGIELYELLKKCFDIDVCINNVKSQMDVLNDSADTYLNIGFNKIGYLFAVIAALYSLEQIFLDKLITNPNNAIWWLGLLFSLVGGVIVFCIVFIKYRKHRK